MTEPASNVMYVICSYSPVPPQTAAIAVDIDWCLELAASVDQSLESPVAHDVTRAKYIFETLAVHPTRKFAAAPANLQERRSLNSPYFKLLKARMRRLQHAPAKSPVSNLKLALKPSCRAYLNMAEEKAHANFRAKPDNKKLRELLCTMSEAQKTPAPIPQDAVRTADDPVRTLRLQPFFVAQPMFSPA